MKYIVGNVTKLVKRGSLYITKEVDRRTPLGSMMVERFYGIIMEMVSLQFLIMEMLFKKFLQEMRLLRFMALRDLLVIGIWFI